MSDNRTEERNEAFDSAMREKMAGYEPTVPHALWTRISAELNEEEATVTPSIPHYTKAAQTPRWKIAVAAAVILTVGAGSLLFNFDPKNEIGSTSIPTATKADAPAAVTTVAATTASENTTTVRSIAVVNKPAVVKEDVKATTEPVTTAQDNNADNAAQTTISNEDSQLANMPAATQNTPVEVGTIPIYSLTRLPARVPLNDEITVIKSTETKKKHHKHSTGESSTKVIVIGQKFDSKPDIRYQVPVRF